MRKKTKKGNYMSRRIGGIEAGGTKMVCAIGNENGELIDRMSIPTETPQKTLAAMADYFKDASIDALGIGCFGPLDLDASSKTYGYITKTPKEGWSNVNVLGFFKKELSVPVAIDTDVNAAMLGEIRKGAAVGCDSAIYITVGTGIGVGVYVNGGLLHGLVHPEAGHILLARHGSEPCECGNGEFEEGVQTSQGKSDGCKRRIFRGVCPYHTSCFEGLASGPAIEARWGKGAKELTEDEKVWELEAFYLAQAITNYILCYSPQKIVLGGGVMHVEKLFPMIREKVIDMLGGYVQHDKILKDMDYYIVPTVLGDDSGIVGAMELVR